MVQDYLGQKHCYGETDCIELIRNFYSKDLHLEFSLPSYPKSRDWMKYFSTSNVDKWASTYATKVELTEAKNYDVMVFKSNKSNLVIHFGMYLMPSKIFHIEEGGFSCVQTLSEYWISRLHTIYRHNELV